MFFKTKFQAESNWHAGIKLTCGQLYTHRKFKAIYAAGVIFFTFLALK